MEPIMKRRATVSPAMPYMDQRGGAQGNGRKPTTPNELTITPTVNRGFVVRHTFDNSHSGPGYMPAKEHAFSSHAAMMAHVHVATGGTKRAARVARPSHLGVPTRSPGGRRW
jgi:hypothetical protein